MVLTGGHTPRSTTVTCACVCASFCARVYAPGWFRSKALESARLYRNFPMPPSPCVDTVMGRAHTLTVHVCGEHDGFPEKCPILGLLEADAGATWVTSISLPQPHTKLLSHLKRAPCSGCLKRMLKSWLT
eukprot:1156931-Pelagomonas_calceolata.AAC.12